MRFKEPLTHLLNHLQKIKKPEPEIGDKKSEIKFAFIPKRIQYHIVWLEKYECVYIYTRLSYSFTSLKSYSKSSCYWEVCETKLINKPNGKI